LTNRLRTSRPVTGPAAHAPNPPFAEVELMGKLGGKLPSA
jgi:hypothetical protein